MVSSHLLDVGVYWFKVAVEIGRSFNRAGTAVVHSVCINLFDLSCVLDSAVLLTFEVHLLVWLIPM